MRKFVRIIDANGYFIKDEFVDEINENSIETPCPEGFQKPKWNGSEWIEGLTQEEIQEKIDKLNNQPKEPTELELQQQIINTLGQELAQLKLQFMMGGM